MLFYSIIFNFMIFLVFVGNSCIVDYIKLHLSMMIIFWRIAAVLRSYFQGSQYVRMYGFFFGNSQKCTELGIRTSVHDDFNPCTDFCKSVHGNPYIRTFYRDYCIKMAFFLPFFVFFFVFYQFFPNFRASRKFTIYILW